MSARYPLGTLERLIGSPSSDTTAAVIGAKPATVRQWRRRGLSWAQADQVACRAGFHPRNVWPDWS